MITPITMRDFLWHYGYEHATEEGCQTVYNIWKANKAKLLEKFRKHPNWDEDNLAIIFKEDEYERGFDASAFTPFMDWVYVEYNKLAAEYDDEQKCEANDAARALDYMQRRCRSQFLSAEEACDINSYYPKAKVSEGLKITKAIQRLCKAMGLDKIKDIRPAHENTDRLKDFGFNYQFQMLADAINPTKFKRITVISLNPLDYWGMSFGYKWASCHTIDKWHKRNNPDSSHHYSGCYSAGTESYMLDKSSIIFYVVREDYEGNTYWDEDKMNRVVFCVNEDASMILESRVYPDGRDGGDSSLAGQFRNNMQKVITDLWDLNNYWSVKKGTDICRQHTTTDGQHFKDYYEYEDCNISFNKDECNNYPKIRIGHDAVCPGCGESHYGEKNIMCWNCGGEENDEDCVHCERCGSLIRLDHDEYVYVNDYYYCDGDCAREDGNEICWDDDEWYSNEDLYYCEDDGHWHNEYHCYRDDYDDFYYSGDPYIRTYDSYVFSSEENAEAYGYVCEHFTGEWKRKDYLDYDNYHEEWFDSSHRNAICTEDGKYFIDDDSAEYAGYVETPYCEWILKADAIETEDGCFYESETDAEDDGYEQNEDGVWVLRKEEVLA